MIVPTFQMVFVVLSEDLFSTTVCFSMIDKEGCDTIEIRQTFIVDKVWVIRGLLRA